MAGGSEWSKYTPEQREARRKALSERCRKTNLARSKEMRTRIAHDMGKANKDRKQSESHRINSIKWRKDPVKKAKWQQELRKSRIKWAKENPEEAERLARNIRPGNSFKKTANEEDWWARNFKVSRQRTRVMGTRRKLASIGLDIIDPAGVSNQYLDEVDDFFAEII